MSDELEALMNAAPSAGTEGEQPDLDPNELVEIDLSDAKSYEPLVGTFPMEVKAAENKVTKKGERAIKLTLVVIDGEDRAGAHAWKWIMLQGAGTGRTRKILDALGAGVDWAAPKISSAALVGLRGNVLCKQDPRPDFDDQTEVVSVKKFVDPNAVHLG